LRTYLEEIVGRFAAQSLFPKPPVISFRTAQTHCLVCRSALKVTKSILRKSQTLAIGPFVARHVICHCPRCGRKFSSQQLSRLVPGGSCFGFDVMVEVGIGVFLKHKSELEIQQSLARLNVTISIREIGFLAQRFIVYLALAHEDARPELKMWMASHGGYILHVDGTNEGGSPHLMTALDELSEVVLGNIKIPSENKPQIISFFQQLRQDYGVPKALVHDMASTILQAADEVFPNVPDFICHFHFLRDIGKDLFASEYYYLKKALVSKRIRTELSLQAKRIKRTLEQKPDLARSLAQLQFSSTSEPLFEKDLHPLVMAYTMILWILDSNHELNGYGFPFDQEKLSFFRRIELADGLVDRLHRAGVTHKKLAKIRVIFRPILKNRDLIKKVNHLKQKVAIFNRLRRAMKITDTVQSQGLNDPGSSDIMTIKARVSTFRHDPGIALVAQTDSTVKRLIHQIDKYWDKLFADPITVQTPSGPVVVQPQRTNNILERFFRNLKKGFRKKGGLHSLKRTLKTMLADTPLVRNLNNPEYLAIILQGHHSLAEKFAQMEITRVRENHLLLKKNAERIPPFLKRILRTACFTDALFNTAVAFKKSRQTCRQ
jgi:hypothetical protein